MVAKGHSTRYTRRKGTLAQHLVYQVTYVLVSSRARLIRYLRLPLW